MILLNIRKTIKAKMEQEHGVRDDGREGFTDDWAAIAPQVQSEISSPAPTHATLLIQSQTTRTLGIEPRSPAPNNQSNSHKTGTSFDVRQVVT